MSVPRAPEERIADTVRFYELLTRLERRVGGVRTLATCDGRMDWPRRGVYFPASSIRSYRKRQFVLQ